MVAIDGGAEVGDAVTVLSFTSMDARPVGDEVEGGRSEVVGCSFPSVEPWSLMTGEWTVRGGGRGREGGIRLGEGRGRVSLVLRSSVPVTVTTVTTPVHCDSIVSRHTRVQPPQHDPRQKRGMRRDERGAGEAESNLSDSHSD